MKLSEIINKTFDVVTEYPMILVPLVIPFLLRLIVNISGLYWVTSTNYIDTVSNIQWDRLEPQQAMDLWRGMLPKMAAAGIASTIIDIIIWAIAMIGFSMVIAMTLSYFNGKKMTISESFNAISGKIFILLIASAVVWVTKIVGVCALCIGAYIAWVFLSEVRQGIVIHNLGLADTLSKSYHLARDNFFDFSVILLLFFLIKIVIGLLPIVGNPLGFFVDVFSVVAMTLLYIDRG
jgi:hypothetical protein